LVQQNEELGSVFDELPEENRNFVRALDLPLQAQDDEQFLITDMPVR
jgi:hypothetical protein